MSEQSDKALAKKGQTLGLVIAITMVLWIFANLAGPQLGLPGRYALLFDFAALAAMIWVFVGVWQMWQIRQQDKQD